MVLFGHRKWVSSNSWYTMSSRWKELSPVVKCDKVPWSSPGQCAWPLRQPWWWGPQHRTSPSEIPWIIAKGKWCFDIYHYLKPLVVDQRDSRTTLEHTFVSCSYEAETAKSQRKFFGCIVELQWQLSLETLQSLTGKLRHSVGSVIMLRCEWEHVIGQAWISRGSPSLKSACPTVSKRVVFLCMEYSF